MKNKKIIVAGHVSLDITPSFPVMTSAVSLSEFIRPGKLVNVGPVTIKPGGCVTNTGGALHFFGADVTLMYKIGDDVFGRILEEDYKQHGYKTSCIQAINESTSYTIIIAPPGCDRFFLHDTAVNNTFSAAELDYSVIEQAGFFHFGYPSLMKHFYEDDGSELFAMFKQIKNMGVVTSMDTAAIDPDGPVASYDWNRILEKVLPYVDFFVPSIEELYFMVDKPYYYELQKRAAGQDICRFLSIEQDIAPLAERMLDMGCKAILLKCGAPGMYLAAKKYAVMRDIFDDTVARKWDSYKAFSKSFIPERILSGTGAGDTAIAAFIYGIVNDFSPEDCLDIASGTGASCLTEYDALSGLLSIAQLKEKIARGWKHENLI